MQTTSVFPNASSSETARSVASAALIAATLCGCTAYGTRPESPAHGGRAWAEASSQHFRVVADLPAEETAARALELEQGLDAINQVAFEHARTPLEPTTVVVFSEGSDFHAFAPELIEGQFYRKLWALVHMLHDGPEPYPTRFKQFLQNVQHDRVDAAWQKAFAGVSAGDFDRDFKHYLALRQLAVFEFGKRNANAAPSITTRALTDAEVHVLLARLSPWQGAPGAAAKRDLDEAVAEAPKSAEAHYFRGLFWAAQHRFDSAADDLLTAARLAPDDPRYLLGVLTLRAQQQLPSTGHVHAGDPVMQAAEPLAKVARSPLQFRALATVYYDLGELERALVYVQRSVALAPIDAFNLDVEALILHALGCTPEARAAPPSARLEGGHAAGRGGLLDHRLREPFSFQI